MKIINNIINWIPFAKNSWLLKDKCGIYIIRNKINNKFYIGSSKYLYTRITEHRCRLRKLDGINPHIQRAYNKYGEENFEYSVLEFCNPKIKYEREQYYLDLLLPEYNTTLQVQANKGLPRSEHAKQKSSETQRKMVREGKTRAKKAYIYNVETYTLVCECNSIKDARKLLKITSGANIESSLFKKKYIIHLTKFETLGELMNFVMLYIKIPKNKKYIIIKNNLGDLKYYHSVKECCKQNNISQFRYETNRNATKDNPLIINDNLLLFFSKEFIPMIIPDTEIENVPEFKEIEIKRGSV